MNVKNETPYPHGTAVVYDARGNEIFVVMVKATVRLDSGAPAPPFDAVRSTDDFFPTGALRYPCDTSFNRSGTDVICYGTIYSPGGAAVSTCIAELRVAEMRRRLRAFGRRRWLKRPGGWSPSEPERFEGVALGFENAFGGPGFLENPIGMGFVSEGTDPTGVELPRIEDESALLKAPSDRPSPASAGAIAAHWRPRADRVGTYDEHWKRNRAPLLPEDFDPRFFEVASAGLCTQRPLVGGEPIELLGLTPSGHMETVVPRLPLRMRVGKKPVRPTLDRLVLEPDTERVLLTYRVTVDVTGRLEHLPDVAIVEKAVLGRNEHEP